MFCVVKNEELLTLNTCFREHNVVIEEMPSEDFQEGGQRSLSKESDGIQKTEFLDNR